MLAAHHGVFASCTRELCLVVTDLPIGRHGSGIPDADVRFAVPFSTVEAVNLTVTTSPTTDAAGARPSSARLYTWISSSGRLTEQVRIVQRGESYRASGRIISAAEANEVAFSASYEAEVDDARSLRRVHLTVTTEEYERSIDLARDDEGAWLLSDPSGNRSRVGGSDLVDVDVSFSVFFGGVILRRLALHSQPDSVTERVLSVDMLSLDVREDEITISSDDHTVHGITATTAASVTVDSDGVIVDVHGLTSRVERPEEDTAVSA